MSPRATLDRARFHASRRRDAASAGFSAVELAAVVSLFGSLAAVAIPTFARDFKASRFVEPTEGLAHLAAGAAAYAAAHAVPVTPKSLLVAFPRSVGLTPSAPPRGHLASDPPGTWADPTWQALQFPTTGQGFSFAEGDPHAFAFAFDSGVSTAGGPAGASRAWFVAHAHGDLDGDGARSTFEVRGHVTADEGVTVEPGMYVEDAFE